MQKNTFLKNAYFNLTPTTTKENPADSKHVCQIVTTVTYCLSDCHWCLSDCLSSMFAGLSSLPDFLCQIFMKIRQITHAIRQTLLVFHRCCHKDKLNKVSQCRSTAGPWQPWQWTRSGRQIWPRSKACPSPRGIRAIPLHWFA